MMISRAARIVHRYGHCCTLACIALLSLIFVLFAVFPEKMPLVLPNIRKVLKPNGYLLFCGYATGDLAQIAFAWAIVDIYFCV
ncbi:methyltransferase-like protein 6 isoform X2 [Camellia sinensis]|uniref:methyltransferase-like protein 6 isoform X2 n=1 Tax=Camellia sinensis TaxID=4442 RepID=UPI001036D8EF|nr:methyltransferase-like protein 6 isoform X2 [Camellia sinensis]